MRSRPPRPVRRSPALCAAVQANPNLALAGRLNSAALVARRESLRAHGLLGQCPFVTPVMLMPGHDPGQYLHIQEKNTGTPANVWSVAVVDSGADVSICSLRFVEANGLEFGADPIPIVTADGSLVMSLGELLHPLEFWLAKDTPFATKAVSVVQVMPGRGAMFDLILSMEVICQWCAHTCTATSTLVFKPDWWTKRRLKRTASLPVSIAARVVPEDDEA